MCGIAGIIHNQAADYIEQCSASIAHRGPDARREFIGEGIALAHRRLAIQDLSERGAQPMYSRDLKHLIILNGEIYNHWDLRKELLPEVNFVSTSDTETLLYGYIKYGKEILNHLNGIFTFAIYNTETTELFIVRDQFGIKPLYYFHNEGTFLFSSEIKTFIDFPGIDKKLDFKNLLHYVSFLYSPGPSTPFAKIKKLEAGHFIKISTNNPDTFILEKYYEIPFNGKYSGDSEEVLIDRLDNKLREAVNRQLLSDVPVGFFLSGGLDSSLIVAIAKKLRPDVRLQCFTIDDMSKQGAEGFAKDLPYAQKVAEYLDVDLEIIRADIDIINDFDKMIWHLDEPQADAAPLNVWNISKRARELGYVVLLGGTAGDDLFSGYRRHKLLYYDTVMSLFPRPIYGLAHKLISILSMKNSSLRRLKKVFESSSIKSETERSASYFLWLSNAKAKSLFAELHKKEVLNYKPQSILINALLNIPLEKNALNQMLYWELKYFLPDHNLNYTDKMSMAHGVEVRVPFLDKELVEFSTTIPPHLKMKRGQTKYILKKVAERYLPHEVIYRPKTGFGAPIRKWIKQDLFPSLHQYFNGKECKKQGIFDCNNVIRLLDDNAKDKVDASYPILAIMAIKSWYAQFVEKSRIHEEVKIKS